LLKKLAAVALAGAAFVTLTLTTTSSSVADPISTKVAHRVDIPAAAPASAEVGTQAVPCWASFEPSAPNGGPMTHHYKNCNAFTVLVTSGFVDGGGQVVTYVNWCRRVDPGQETSFPYSSTNQGVNYTTVLCAYV
jgi:hypothetical protein